MHYAAETTVAFNSVEKIMRDVNNGWLLRYMHANGASFFFIAVYLHIARGLYYGSYKAPREILWILGVVIFLLMMATAFMGYVLPWVRCPSGVRRLSPASSPPSHSSASGSSSSCWAASLSTTRR